MPEPQHRRRATTALLAASLASVAATSLAACAGDVMVPPAEGNAIDAYIAGLGKLVDDPSQVTEGARSPAEREGDYSCSTQDYKETRQYDKIVAYAANSQSLWPGALVAGDAITSGLFTPIVMDRKPLSFSVSLENIAGTRSATIDDPSLSRFRDALGKILASDVTGATAADIYSEIEEVHSKEQLAIALGAKVDWLSGGVSASFDWSNTSAKSRYVVKYAQAYYTVDVDAFGAPSDTIGDKVPLEEVQAKMPAGSPPLYVSSVTYGRMVLFTFESEYSAQELGAALDFVYHGGVDVSGSTSVTYEEMLSKTKITAYILGGAGGDAAMAIDSYQGLLDFIHSGGDYSKDSPGAPIAYKLAYLTDNAPARLSFTDDYTVKTCERVSQKVLVKLKSIQVEDAGGDAGDDLELYGRIWTSGVAAQTLFDRGEGDAVTIHQGQMWPSSGGEISESILEVSPQAGASIGVGADLTDSDGIFPDDSMGNETVIAPFETGWRRDVQVLLTGDSARIVVTFELTPV
jgi:thiol-activated cytolysin